MDIPDTLLNAVWYWTAWAVWSLVFVLGLRHAPWATLKNPVRLNVWLAMIVFLMLVWRLKTGIHPGLDFHLVGAALMTLCVGAWLAFFGLSIVAGATELNAGAGLFAFALNALLLAGLPVVVARLTLIAAERLLPRHFFVFIFVNGFLGSWLAIMALGAVACMVLAAAGVYPASYLTSEYFPYFPLLGFSEAWLAGALLTLFVVYRPSWVVAFDDARYLGTR